MGVDAEGGSVQLDAFAVDLDNHSGGRHILQGRAGVARRQAAMLLPTGWGPLPAPSAADPPDSARGSSGRVLGLQGGLAPSPPSPPYRVLSVLWIQLYLQELLLLRKAEQQEAREDQRVKHLEQV